MGIRRSQQALNQAQFAGPFYGFAASFDLELGVDVGTVTFDSGRGYKKLLGDLLVPLMLC